MGGCESHEEAPSNWKEARDRMIQAQRERAEQAAQADSPSNHSGGSSRRGSDPPPTPSPRGGPRSRSRRAVCGSEPHTPSISSSHPSNRSLQSSRASSASSGGWTTPRASASAAARWTPTLTHKEQKAVDERRRKEGRDLVRDARCGRAGRHGGAQHAWHADHGFENNDWDQHGLAHEGANPRPMQCYDDTQYYLNDSPRLRKGAISPEGSPQSQARQAIKLQLRLLRSAGVITEEEHTEEELTEEEITEEELTEEELTEEELTAMYPFSL